MYTKFSLTRVLPRTLRFVDIKIKYTWKRRRKKNRDIVRFSFFVFFLKRKLIQRADSCLSEERFFSVLSPIFIIQSRSFLEEVTRFKELTLENGFTVTRVSKNISCLWIIRLWTYRKDRLFGKLRILKNLLFGVTSYCN